MAIGGEAFLVYTANYFLKNYLQERIVLLVGTVLLLVGLCVMMAVSTVIIDIGGKIWKSVRQFYFLELQSIRRKTAEFKSNYWLFQSFQESFK